MEAIFTRNQIRRALAYSAAVLAAIGAALAAPPSALYLRGYTVIPSPQQTELRGADFLFNDGWRLELGEGVRAEDVAVESLHAQLSERYGLKLRSGGEGSAVELMIHPGSVKIGAATDSDKIALAEQAYLLNLDPKRIRITANAPAGLFYGVETLVQLVKSERGKLWLPEGQILDWPDVRLREVFWDELEHLDHVDVIKQAIERSAFFKMNALVLRLNQHFEYQSAPALVDPYALTAAQLQDVTNYGLRFHIQVIPYLDGPAHVNFILDHDEYAKLREFPETTFEMCSTNPETYKLLEGMYQNLMDANRGVKYFLLSTDEAWFIGKANNSQCNEAARAQELGSQSKLWVEFTQKTASYLQGRGRQVIFWGETPMQAGDIPLLPPGLINGEVYDTTYNKAFRAHGISQIVYTNSLPDDPLFPAYYVLSSDEQIHPRKTGERATAVFDEISYTSARQEADIMGAGIFAWGDLGPHPETFWLGYAVGASAAWRPGSTDPHELANSFYRLFYGSGASNISRLYQLMSTQAQFYASSWDSRPGGPLVFGYSYGIGPFTPEHETIDLPSVPSGDYLRLTHNWLQENSTRLKLTGKFLGENDELLNLLFTNLGAAQFNRYNLEVYLSIAQSCRQNLLLFEALGEISGDLDKAQEHASKLRYADAVSALDAAIDAAWKIRDERNQALYDTTAIWYKTWFPRVREANGRHTARAPRNFVDTESTEGARRRQEGLAYLMEREFSLPFGDWVHQIQAARNRYAAAHKLAARDGDFDWQDTATLHSQAAKREL